jgi:hypothetical protein
MVPIFPNANPLCVVSKIAPNSVILVNLPPAIAENWVLKWTKPQLQFSALSTVTMEQHALEILKRNDLWNWHDTKWIKTSGIPGGKYEIPTAKFLHFLIVESQQFGGDVLDHFWKQLGTCDEKLKENSQSKTLITQSYSLTFVCHSQKSEGGFRVSGGIFQCVISGIRFSKCQLRASVRNGSGVLYSSLYPM